jgi:tetratricopeptide (TPR) repeat protein
MGYCKSAEDVWPKNRGIMFVRARLLASTGDKRSAEEYFQALTSEEMRPPMPAAHLEAARFYERSGKWREAAANMITFVNLVGEDAFALCRAAQYAAQANDIKTAEELLKRARKAQAFDDPRNREDFDHIMILARAAVRARQKRAKEVVADFKLLLRRFSRDPQNFFNMGAQIIQMSRSRQFQPVAKEKEFVDFMNWLQNTMQQLLQRFRSGGGR